MSHNIYWDADQSDVLHIDLNGVTTWDAYHEIINAAFERVEATQQSVYAILHDRGTKPPEGPLPHFRKTIARAYATPNLMLAVSVDSHFPAFFARMVKVVLDIYFLNRPNKVPYVTSEAEAYAIIATHRQQRARSS